MFLGSQKTLDQALSNKHKYIRNGSRSSELWLPKGHKVQVSKMTSGCRWPVCIENPIVRIMWNTMQKIVVFRVCRTLETFPCTPRAHQHQKIHLQHKIKNWKFSTYFSCVFEVDFHRKFDAFCSRNLTLPPNTLVRKGVFTAKIIKISTKIDPKITWKWYRKIFNFLFYVANVFFEASHHGDSMGTLLDSYRLEKPPKLQSDFPQSIIIGIPMQIDYLLWSFKFSVFGTK